VHQIVSTKYFEMAVLSVILLSSISLATENPVDEHDLRNEVLNYLDWAFTAVFTVELVLKVRQTIASCSLITEWSMLFKVIDQGVILHRGSYARDFWNVMDAIVVICALVGYAAGYLNDKAQLYFAARRSIVGPLIRQ